MDDTPLPKNLKASQAFFNFHETHRWKVHSEWLSSARGSMQLMCPSRRLCGESVNLTQHGPRLPLRHRGDRTAQLTEAGRN